jgi:sterol desaturase/sphingolipid hydroxylase (fatty acid hydroxylase superfamily)
MDAFGDFLASLASFWANQLLATFVAPGSTFSIAALAITLMTAALVTMRRRSVKLRVLVRAMLPRRMWRTRSGRADIAWFAFSVGGGAILFGWALLAGSTISGWTFTQLTAVFGAAPAGVLPPWLGIAVATISLFLAYEFAYWLDHWAMHRFNWAWAFHQVHHSAESLSLMTIARVHPVETIGFHNLVAIVMGATAGGLAYQLGSAVSPLMLFGTSVLTLASAVLIGHLQHSHFWITLGPRWGKWLLGPAHHQIHHSVAPEHHDRNFGNILTIFDRMFGTFVMPEAKRQRIAFGIDAPHFDHHSLGGMTLQPFIESFRTLPLRARACDEAVYARKGIAPGAGLLWRDQPGGLHARDHEGGLASRSGVARVP